MAILKKVDAAAKAVSGVSYRVNSAPGGIATDFVAAAEGGGVMFGWTGPAAGEVRHAGQDHPARTPASRSSVTGGSDGETFFLVDHVGKKAYQDFDPAVMGSGGNALFGVSMAEFVHPSPFDDEIDADTPNSRAPSWWVGSSATRST